MSTWESYSYYGPDNGDLAKRWKELGESLKVAREVADRAARKNASPSISPTDAMHAVAEAERIIADHQRERGAA